ncbi:hypothetical protein GW17_00060208, partial [Ensete ventricosum]
VSSSTTRSKPFEAPVVLQDLAQMKEAHNYSSMVTSLQLEELQNCFQAAIIPTLTPHHSITWGHNSTRGVIFEEDPNPQPSPMGKGLCIASSGPSFDPPKVASLCEEAIKEPPALWRMVPLRKRGGDRGPGCRVVLAVNSSCLQAEEVGQCLAGARRRAEVETFQMALELRLALRRAKEAEVPMEEAWDVMNVIEDEVVETVAEANKQVEVL